jgi:hypothetical protein
MVTLGARRRNRGAMRGVVSERWRRRSLGIGQSGERGRLGKAGVREVEVQTVESDEEGRLAVARADAERTDASLTSGEDDRE